MSPEFGSFTHFDKPLLCQIAGLILDTCDCNFAFPGLYRVTGRAYLSDAMQTVQFNSHYFIDNTYGHKLII